MQLRNNTKTIDSSSDGVNWSPYIVKSAAATIHPVFIGNINRIYINNPARTNACDVVIDTGSGTKLRFSLYDIQGQSTWLPTQSGLNQACNDLTTWLNS